MLVFPQLTTGAAALYPVARKYTARTVVNTLGDGSTVVFSDPDGAVREWEVRAIGLTLAEWTAIEALFQSVSGRLGTFTFLDPVGNLLLRSEEFDHPEWNNSPLIQLTPGIGDPFGSSRATRVVNGAQAAGSVSQMLATPGTFHYVLSVWARTTGGSNVALTATGASGSAMRSFGLTAQWRRISMEVGLGVSSDSMVFGAQLEAGASVDLLGMQVEAQPGVSDYRKTGASGGVYGEARFAQDQLSVTARGTDLFDAVIRIVAR